MEDPLDEIKAAFGKAIAAQAVVNQERRTICKKFYVSATEDQAIQNLRQGVKESSYFRSKVLGKAIPRPRPVIPQINRDTYIHIAGIRSNINQITKAINIAAKEGRSLLLSEAHLDELKQLESLLVQVQLQLSQANNTAGEASDDWQD